MPVFNITDRMNEPMPQALKEKGYVVLEDEDVVELLHHGEMVDCWSAKSVKPKWIIGKAWQHYLMRYSHELDCQLTTDAGGLLI